MKQEEIKEKLLSEFGSDVIRDSVDFRDQISVTVSKEKILDVCRYLKEDPDLSFNFLSFVGAVDRHPRHLVSRLFTRSIP